METFFQPNFSRPRLRLFSWLIFLRPRLRLFSQNQFFWNQHWDTLILQVQNFASVFFWSTFWYLHNLRGYRQSQMLHCKMRSTLASEVFHAKVLCLSGASEVLIKYSNQRKRKWLAPSFCCTSPCWDQLCKITSRIKMNCVCNICSKSLQATRNWGCISTQTRFVQHQQTSFDFIPSQKLDMRIKNFIVTIITKLACMTCNKVCGSAVSIPSEMNQNPT